MCVSTYQQSFCWTDQFSHDKMPVAQVEMWQGGARFEGRMIFWDSLEWKWWENHGECVNFGFVGRPDSWMKILGESCWCGCHVFPPFVVNHVNIRFLVPQRQKGSCITCSHSQGDALFIQMTQDLRRLKTCAKAFFLIYGSSVHIWMWFWLLTVVRHGPCCLWSCHYHRQVSSTMARRVVLGALWWAVGYGRFPIIMDVVCIRSLRTWFFHPNKMLNSLCSTVRSLGEAADFEIKRVAMVSSQILWSMVKNRKYIKVISKPARRHHQLMMVWWWRFLWRNSLSSVYEVIHVHWDS